MRFVHNVAGNNLLLKFYYESVVKTEDIVNVTFFNYKNIKNK